MATGRNWFEGRIQNISGKLFCFAVTPDEATKLLKKAARKILNLSGTAFVSQPVIKKIPGNAIPNHSAPSDHSYVIDGRGERIPLFH